MIKIADTSFNKHAPIRKKYVCAKEVPFMTKDLHNAIMKRSRYRNKVLKDKSQTNRENHKIQQNVCKKLLRKTRKSSSDSLNIKILRITEGEKIILNEAEKHIPDDKKYAKLLIQSFKTLSQI